MVITSTTFLKSALRPLLSVNFELTSKAREWLAEKGYDKAMGARPMARVIQEELKKPLANEILFGKLADGGTVKVSVKDKKIRFDYESSLTPA